ncbi:MAG: hypothetical protein K6G11_09305, partial [Lachnospiraceae bacterium]|nr:hypothetical protein [Lachnospiraceae bacterium]
MKKTNLNRTKLMAVLCTFAMTVSMVPTASTANAADTPELPFKLMAPSNASIDWLEGSDSPTTMQYAVTKNSESGMSEYLSDISGEDEEAYLATKKKLEELGYSDVYVNLQMDWAIDDPENGWHYTSAWDNMGMERDEENQSDYSVTSIWDIVDGTVDAKTTDEAWVFRGVLGDFDSAEFYDWYGSPKDSENGYVLGLKEQLKEGQYSIVPYDEETGESFLSIDYDAHTVYARFRYAVTIDKNDEEGTREYCFSDWSETAAYGKDAKDWEPYSKDTLAAPEVSDLHMID